MKSLEELKLKRDIAALEVQIAEQRLDFIELIRRARSLLDRHPLHEQWFRDTDKFFTVEPAAP